MEVAAECISTRLRAKHRVLWEILSVKKKRDNVKTASLYNKRNPTNSKAQKLKKAQRKLTNAYLKKTNKRNTLKTKSIILETRLKQWQTVNEASKRKSISRIKLKAATQEERIHLWKEHFKNLFGKTPKVTDKRIMKIINDQLDIKLGQFMQEELDVVLTKTEKLGFDEIPPEVWKTKKFDDILLRHCNAVYNQKTIDRERKGCILPFPKNDDLGIVKNYRGITLTSIVAKIYDTLLLNRIESEMEEILWKNEMVFEKIDPQHHKFWWPSEL